MFGSVAAATWWLAKAGPDCRANSATTISASSTIAMMIPNGRFLVKPDLSEAKSMSSIMTTNRNRTATAPT